VPVREPSGRITRWYGTSTDVDDLKQVEDRLASVLDVVSDAFIAVDSTRSIVSVNAAGEQRFRQSARELAGNDVFSAIPVLRQVESTVLHAPAEADLTIRDERARVKTMRDPNGGVWIFIQSATP
jgi:PAS domain S-box-containing protein